MSFLIDTHVFLWFILDDPRLSTVASGIVADPTSGRSLSIVSLWEMAIKHAKGNLTDDPTLTWRHLADEVARLQLGPVGLSADDVAVLVALPTHHKDPFDRMLIAQSICRGIPIVTADAAFADYPVAVIW